jgi:hypothetical protein
MLGKLTHIDHTDFSNLTLKPKVEVSKYSDIKLLPMFKTFTISNLSTGSKIFVPHASFRSFYINYSKGGSSIINIKKFFQKWKLTYHLLFNLFFYRINLLTFTPSFFRNEALALNWVEHTQMNLIWRYVRPFLASKPNKINDYGEFIFRKLKYLGMSTSLVVDVLYHSKTIYYLRRLNYYSIGLVPTIYHDKFVDFAVPVAADSLLSQVFFVRLLINLRHSVSHKTFVNLKRTWSTRT